MYSDRAPKRRFKFTEVLLSITNWQNRICITWQFGFGFQKKKNNAKIIQNQIAVELLNNSEILQQLYFFETCVCAIFRTRSRVENAHLSRVDVRKREEAKTLRSVDTSLSVRWSILSKLLATSQTFKLNRIPSQLSFHLLLEHLVFE